MNSSEDVPASPACINCGHKLKEYVLRFPVLEQWPTVIAVFTEWLSPYILKQNDLLCKVCLDHAENKIRQLIKAGEITDETQPLPSSLLSQIENRKVCVLCAKSLLRTRSTPVLWPNGPERNQLVSNLICEAVLVPHKKVDADSLICHRCWQKMCRELDQRQSNSAVNQDAQNHDTQNNELQEEYIKLPNYRRSLDISTHCVFENCPNQELHSISEELRAIIIKRYRYLVTAQARVCQQHLLRNNWATLFDAENSTSIFKPEHIEHVLSFIEPYTCTDIDFNDILNVDNSVVEYFLGLSRESFSVILKTLPELQDVENGVIGLMGLLMKYSNGGPISKVAGLLNICPKSLESAMTNVLEVLRYSPVTVNMGIEYLLQTNM